MLKEYLSNIANTIRSKLSLDLGQNKTDKINAQDFAEGIEQVYESGYYASAARILGDWSMEFEVPYGVKSIRMGAFYYHNGITKLVLPSSVTGIKNSAFRSCSRLTEITIPENVSSISNSYVFAQNSSLTKITFKNYRDFGYDFDALTFLSDNVLTDFVIENGEVPRSLNLQYSPLTVESMKNIITRLKNYSNTDYEGTYTLTLKADCWTVLEASGTPYEDGLTDNENLTWRDYIQTSLGWLVA